MIKFWSGLAIGIYATGFLWYISNQTDWPNQWLKQQESNKTYEIIIGWKNRNTPNGSSITSSGDGLLVLTNDELAAQRLRQDIYKFINEWRNTEFNKP